MIDSVTESHFIAYAKTALITLRIEEIAQDYVVDNTSAQEAISELEAYSGNM